MTTESLDVSAVLRPGKFFLQKIGLWFENMTQISMKKRILRSMIIFNHSLFSAMSFISILNIQEKTLVQRTFEFMFLVRQISVGQKILIFRFGSKDICSLFNNAFEDINVPEVVKVSFDNYKRDCNKLHRAILVVIVITYLQALAWIVSIVVLSYFDDSKISTDRIMNVAIVIPFWMPFDLSTYPLVKKIVFVYQILGVQPVMIVILGFFSFYCASLTLAIKMYNHLNEVLETLQKPISREPPFDYGLWIRQNQKVKEILSYAVQHHTRSLK
jgi:hypothetical protein